MRGTKLTAWRIPPMWKDLQGGKIAAPEASIVPQKQYKMLAATREVVNTIAKEVRGGLLETVGIESALSFNDGKCSIVLQLPTNADAELIARAIDAENVEAWCDENKRVHVGINPWNSTKDVDQTVLCTTKVVHVLLGIHASDTNAAQPKTFAQKLLSAAAAIMTLQKNAAKKQD